VIRPLFGWLRGRAVGERTTTERSASDRTDDASSARLDKDGPSGRAAGRREVAAIEALRHTTFVDREQASLHTQLARAPRDVGALFGLLAWHARRGERGEMASFAHALWDETDAEGELWRRAAALGRSVDPHNPLYDEDPFAALAAHAALQPVTASLALDAFDLSLLVGHVEEAGNASADSLADTSLPISEPAVSGRDRPPKTSPDAQHARVGSTRPSEAEPARLADKPFFDIFSQPTGQLPASVLNLDMDLDIPSTGASTWLAGWSSDAAANKSTNSMRSSIAGSLAVSSAANARREEAKHAASALLNEPSNEPPHVLPNELQPAPKPAWVLARPRRVRAGGKISHRSKK